jgi:hypothetical protein
LGLARPCSHFSRVLKLMRNCRANTAREQPNFRRVPRTTLASTFGSGTGTVSAPDFLRRAPGTVGSSPGELTVR